MGAALVWTQRPGAFQEPPKCSPGASRLSASHLALTLLARRATVTLGSKPGWRIGRARTPASSGWAPLHSEQFPQPPSRLPSPQSAPPRRASRPALDPGSPSPEAPAPTSRLARLLSQGQPESRPVESSALRTPGPQPLLRTVQTSVLLALRRECLVQTPGSYGPHPRTLCAFPVARQVLPLAPAGPSPSWHTNFAPQAPSLFLSLVLTCHVPSRRVPPLLRGPCRQRLRGMCPQLTRMEFPLPGLMRCRGAWGDSIWEKSCRVIQLPARLGTPADIPA